MQKNPHYELNNTFLFGSASAASSFNSAILGAITLASGYLRPRPEDCDVCIKKEKGTRGSHGNIKKY
jgi:hypothetical protein